MESTVVCLTVLIVDDSEEDRASFRRYLIQAGEHDFTFHEAETLQEGVALFREATPDCVLLDFNLPDGNGLEYRGDSVALDYLGEPVAMLTSQITEKIVHISKTDLALYRRSFPALSDADDFEIHC